MGKIRVATLGDEEQEKEQKRKAEARREGKKAKKAVEQTDDVSVDETAEPSAEGAEPSEKKEKKQRKTKQKIRSKKYIEKSSLIDKNTLYPLADAVSLVKQTSMAKFDGTVEIHLNLNPSVLGEKGDKKDFRGSVTLPHGTGKKIRVVIADDALIAEVEAGKIDFDILVAHPSMMAKLARVARTLGPKGLMPNPKTGTVTEDPEKRVKELSQGQVNFKTEPGNPIIHMAIGKVSFEDKQLSENVRAMIDAVGRGKIVKATLTSTMGPGVKLAIQ